MPDKASPDKVIIGVAVTKEDKKPSGNDATGDGIMSALAKKIIALPEHGK